MKEKRGEDHPHEGTEAYPMPEALLPRPQSMLGKGEGGSTSLGRSLDSCHFGHLNSAILEMKCCFHYDVSTLAFSLNPENYEKVSPSSS